MPEVMLDIERLGLPSMWFTSSEAYADLAQWTRPESRSLGMAAKLDWLPYPGSTLPKDNPLSGRQDALHDTCAWLQNILAGRDVAEGQQGLPRRNGIIFFASLGAQLQLIS